VKGRGCRPGAETEPAAISKVTDPGRSSRKNTTAAAVENRAKFGRNAMATMPRQTAITAIERM